MPTDFPKVPEKVWWKIREKFVTSVPTTGVTASYLQSLLEISEASARTYLPQLKQLGLIDDTGKPTPEALEWRLDSGYDKVCSAVVERVYPEEVRDLFPGPDVDRSRCAEWFARYSGIGTGAAGDYAKTYVMLRTPLEVAKNRSVGREKQKAATKREARPERKEAEVTAGKRDSTVLPTSALHVNLQICISPEATNEQIEIIFRNMRKYLLTNE